MSAPPPPVEPSKATPIPIQSNQTPPRRSSRRSPRASSSADRPSRHYFRPSIHESSPSPPSSTPPGGFNFTFEKKNTVPVADVDVVTEEEQETKTKTDAFDFGEMFEALPLIMGASEEKGKDRERLGARELWGVGIHLKFRGQSLARIPRGKERKKVGINELPDEILIQIFEKLSDTEGFRSQPTVHGPSWYTPPLRICLVSRRWHSVADSVFYRTISIKTRSRIAPLYRSLSASPSLASLVRRLVMSFSGQALTFLLEEEEANLAIRSRVSPPPTSDGPQSSLDHLRAILNLLPGLLQIDIAGLPPSMLFPPPILRSQHLGTITAVTLGSDARFAGGPALNLKEVQMVLGCLAGVRSLELKGFNNSSSSTAPASRLTTPTSKLKSRSTPSIKPLPQRSRIPLHKLTIRDSTFTTEELFSLFENFSQLSLRVLTVEEVYNPTGALVSGSSSPLIPTLISLLHGLSASVSPSDSPPTSATNSPSKDLSILPWLIHLRRLKLSLFNYPILTSASGAPVPTTSTPPLPTPRRIRPSPSPPSPFPSLETTLLPHLTSLEFLSLSGSLLAPSTPVLLFTTLPSSLKSLTLVSVQSLRPDLVADWLESLLPLKRGIDEKVHGSSFEEPRWKAAPDLRVLEIRGGETEGWNGTGPRWSAEKWRCQRAAWNLGVRWRGW